MPPRCTKGKVFRSISGAQFFDARRTSRAAERTVFCCDFMRLNACQHEQALPPSQYCRVLEFVIAIQSEKNAALRSRFERLIRVNT
jgi:hypothetical protein